MKKAIFISLSVLTIGTTSCSKDSCLDEKQAEREKYQQMLINASDNPVQYDTLLRKMQIRISQFDF